MYVRYFWVTAAWVAVSAVAGAQTFERRAVFTGGGKPGEGKCTVEVVVDAVAEVEIRGDRAVLRTLGGRPAEWRRFQCSAALPPNPADFRFQGVDGRGSQRLVQDARRGGAAVVRIEDPDNGSEGYTFDLIWRGAGYGWPGDRGPDPGISDRERRFDDDRDREFGREPGYRGRFSVDEAVRVCQDAVSDRAYDRLRGARIEFRRTTIDDNPGRNDWVIGTFEARRGNGRSDLYRFSCSVNFDSGRVRSADFEPAGRR